MYLYTCVYIYIYIYIYIHTHTLNPLTHFVYFFLEPYTLHPAPCTPHPTSYTRQPTPCTLRPAPCSLHPTPYTPHSPLPSQEATTWKAWRTIPCKSRPESGLDLTYCLVCAIFAPQQFSLSSLYGEKVDSPKNALGRSLIKFASHNALQSTLARQVDFCRPVRRWTTFSRAMSRHSTVVITYSNERAA